MDRLRTLEVFCRIVELGSFSGAARDLNLPPATVSSWVKGVEASLGVRLLERTTRRVAVTPEGRAYYDRITRVLQDLAEVDDETRSAGTRLIGRVRIAAPRHLMRGVIVPRLSDFSGLHPELELDFSLADRTADLLAEGIDLAIRIGPLQESGLVAKQIAAFSLVTLACPKLALSAPPHPKDLPAEQGIAYRFPFPRQAPSHPWRFERDGETVEIQSTGRIWFDDFDTYIEAGEAGLGFVQVLWCQAKQAIDRGTLVPCYLDWAGVQIPVSLVSPERRNRPRRATGVAEWLENIFSEEVIASEREIAARLRLAADERLNAPQPE